MSAKFNCYLLELSGTSTKSRLLWLYEDESVSTHITLVMNHIESATFAGMRKSSSKYQNPQKRKISHSKPIPCQWPRLTRSAAAERWRCDGWCV